MDEIKIIKDRQKELIYSGYYNKYLYMSKKAVDLISGERKDIFFYPDINYEDTNRSIWNAEFHYHRLKYQIIKEDMGKADNDFCWLSKILGAVRFWIENDFKNSNWWHNQIGMPQALVDIALILENHLTEDLIDGLKSLISRGIFHGQDQMDMIVIPGIGECATADSWTGANLIWGAATTIKYALWLEDESLLRVALKRISDEICFSEEGIQPDGAFCQHGPRWYSGGYGRSFVYELAPIINITRGTSFALPKEKIDMILMHILDGQRMMMKNGIFDFGAVGREFSRKGAIGAGILKSALSLIIEDESIERHGELQAFYNELIKESDTFEGTKYYKSITQLCHKCNGMYIGIRGRTEGIFGSERCNSEGVLGYNLSYGTASCVMNTGKEYFDISPFWDYSMIPGTTARRESDEELCGHGDWSNTLETPCRAFGSDNGKSGILSEKAIHDGISLTVSYFVFNGTMVALGTDITDKNPKKGQIFTTVEQCFANDSYFGNNYAINGNITYKNLDDNTVFFSKKYRQAGKWSRNNLSLSDEVLFENMFSITVPVTEYGKYAYMVSCKKAPKVEVIRNDSECQAIMIDGDIPMAVFHKKCTVTLGDKKIHGNNREMILYGGKI